MPLRYPQLEAIRGGVVVSCQAGPESPLNAPHFIAAMAQSAAMGGAAGFRVDRPESVAAVRAITDLPILGINKLQDRDFDVFITPTYASACAVVDAGANIVGLDGTGRPRPHDEKLDEIIHRLHEERGMPVLADIATVDEALAAAEIGADVVATTLAGYTDYSPSRTGPALDIVRGIVSRISTPVVVEGRIWTVEDVRACFEAGAFAVVIGSAITVPQFITQRFVKAVPASAGRPRMLQPG
ncbi:MAG TPA: N-acetylmannosamine-6-phosphate 2-epimerase [Chloroflexota bacterium]